MKCLSCDVILTDREDYRRFVGSGERVGLCDHCFSFIENEVNTIENPLLSNEIEDEIMEMD